jgi:hypothetical protein
MNRILAVALVACLVAGSAQAAKTYRTWSASGVALTGSAPSSAPTATTDALKLNGVIGFRLTVCATSGNTLTGGTLRAYVYSSSLGLWSRNPDLDQTIGTPTHRCRHFADQSVVAGNNDWVKYVTDAVTVSAGTTVTVSISAVVES